MPGGNGKSRTEAEPPGQAMRIIVIGASAGGVEALSRVVRMLPPDAPVAVFIVLHISASGPSMLPEILTRAGLLSAEHATDGQPIFPGHIYVAPPDHHLLIKPGRMAVTRGPKENNARPAVDPLFRTAARSYGPWVIGVVLSGGLDDGTMGLMDIKRFGGVAVVQDPRDAMFPSMPTSAMENVQVDYVLPLDEIAPLLMRLSREPISEEKGAAFMAINNGAGAPDIAEIGNNELKTRNLTGPPSNFTCPECGGSLWELENGKLLRYRCHIGHAYTGESLMAAQTERLEDALWSALRALEENAGMRRRMANRARKGGWDLMARSYDEQAENAEIRAGLIRSVLVTDRPEQINGRSAAALQAKALRARDLDAGKAARELPPAPVPRRVKPPDPNAAAAHPLLSGSGGSKARRPGGKSRR
jgi:two-component system chemotaxis response regulator CheB